MLKRIPNILTFSRIVIIPILVAVFYMYQLFPEVGMRVAHWIAAALFALACTTDFFDGYLARMWKVESNLGKLLDPIADKLIVAVTIIILVDVNRADVFAGMIIICREIIISGLREFLAKADVSVPVSKLAKIKTGFQMLAIFLLILSTPDTGKLVQIGNSCLWLAAGLTIITGYAYLKAGLKHVKD